MEDPSGPVDVLKLEMDANHADAGLARLWTDGADGKLEDRLTEIVVTFIVAGEAQYRDCQVAHHAWLIKRRADNEAELERRRLEAERKRREEEERDALARREHLFGQARDWRTAQDIRSFVAGVLAEAGDKAPDRRLAAWRTWALSEADAIDPVRRGLEIWSQDADDAACPYDERCECGVECACGCDCSP